MLVKALIDIFVEGSRRKAGVTFEYSGKVTDAMQVIEGELPKPVAVESDVPELTRRELMAQLDQAGIKYAANDNKEKLLSLLGGVKAEIAPAMSVQKFDR